MSLIQPEPKAPVEAPANVDAGESGARMERVGRRWLIWSFILCPCHLPWTLALLGAAAGGSALGPVVEANRNWIGLAVAVLYAVGVAIGFRYLHRAKKFGACRVRYR